MKRRIERRSNEMRSKPPRLVVLSERSQRERKRKLATVENERAKAFPREIQHLSIAAPTHFLVVLCRAISEGESRPLSHSFPV